jgi:hypothetical protein
MIIILGWLIGAVLLHRKAREIGFSIGESAIFSLFGGIIGAVIGFIVSIGLAYFAPRIEVKTEPLDLVSVKTSYGPMYVSSSGGQYYNVMVRDSDGSMYPMRIEASTNVHIREDLDLSDRGYYQATIRKLDTSGIFGLLFLEQGRSGLIVREDIRVPAGTVLTNFIIE